jgi:hypothetical protein
VSAFVDIAWAHFGSPDYRSTFEILLNYTQDTIDGVRSGRARCSARGIASGRRSSPTSNLPRRKTVALQAFSISLVSGMAALAMLRRAVEPCRRRARPAQADARARDDGG